VTEYTIVGVYDNDEMQIFVMYVKAATPEAAVAQLPALLECEADTLLVISIFEGRHKDLNDTTTPSYVSDWP
jgi:hypothetical protein